MIANVAVPTHWDLEIITRTAGSTNMESCWYHLGRLYVPGVTQQALEAAVSGYDHLAIRKTALKQGLRARAKHWLEEQYDLIDLARGITGALSQGEIDTMKTRLTRAQTFVTSKIAAINAATTLEELEAIDLTP